MSPPQRRALIMCEIRFYKVSVAPSEFEALLKSFGWKANPDFDLAGIVQLERLAAGLRQKLRT